MVQESTIRLMTRLADQYHAINLSQGFTDEAAIYEMVWGGIAASLGGTQEGMNRLGEITLQEICQEMKTNTDKFLEMRLKDVLKTLQDSRDIFNQYSYPFGLPELRRAVADYTERFQGFRPDPESEITIVVGATEGMFTSLRAICNPGDEIIIMQPFHEMYSLQAVMYLIKEIGAASVPGDNFYAVGDFGSSYLRFAFRRNIKTLYEAAKRLEIIG